MVRDIIGAQGLRNHLSGSIRTGIAQPTDVASLGSKVIRNLSRNAAAAKAMATQGAHISLLQFCADPRANASVKQFKCKEGVRNS
jgi:hypothetical protein